MNTSSPSLKGSHGNVSHAGEGKWILKFNVLAVPTTQRGWFRSAFGLSSGIFPSASGWKVSAVGWWCSHWMPYTFSVLHSRLAWHSCPLAGERKDEWEALEQQSSFSITGWRCVCRKICACEGLKSPWWMRSVATGSITIPTCTAWGDEYVEFHNKKKWRYFYQIYLKSSVISSHICGIHHGTKINVFKIENQP